MSREHFQLSQGVPSRSYRDVLLGSSTEWEFSTSGAHISPNTFNGEDFRQISNSLALSKPPGVKQVTTNIPQAMFDCFMDMACTSVDNKGKIIETLAILVGYQDADGNGHGTHLVFPVQDGTCSHVNDRGINGQDTVWYIQEYLKPEIEERYHNSQFQILTWIHTHVRGTNICFSSVDLHTQHVYETYYNQHCFGLVFEVRDTNSRFDYKYDALVLSEAGKIRAQNCREAGSSFHSQCFDNSLYCSVKESINITTDDIIVINATKTKPNEGRVLRGHRYGEIIITKVTHEKSNMSENEDQDIIIHEESQLGDGKESDSICKNYEKCGFRGKYLLAHLSRTKHNCKKLYDVESLRRKKKAIHNKKSYEDNKNEILEKRKREYEENRTKILKSRKTHYDQNRTRILTDKKKHYQHRKNIEFTNEDERKRHLKFELDLQDCFSFKCICCHQIMSKSGVQPVKVEDLKVKLDKQSPGLFEKSIQYPLPEDLFLDKKTFLCSTCRKWLFNKKKRPKRSVMNRLDKDVKLDLTDLESILISKNIIFLKIYETPKSQYYAVKDKAVNVPILDDDILNGLNSVKSFPRLLDESGLVPVKLKRKLEYKNKVVEAFVRPEAMIQALRDLKEMGHPSYQDIEIRDWTFQKSLDCEEESDPDEGRRSEEHSDLHFTNNQQYELDGETMMTENFPETSVVINTSENVQNVKHRDDSKSSLSLAPGEGKVPTSLMRDMDWVINAFPQLFPSGRFGLHDEKREDKISAQEYFKQRILNKDKRWATNKSFLFAALYYIERQHLEQAINVSCQRGKLFEGSIINMEDIMSVFDKIIGTPQYWKQRRHEIHAKLEQLGAFTFFFTLSCADRRWPETFVAILRQRGLRISYEPSEEKGTGNYSFQPDKIKVHVDDQDEEGMSLDEYLANEKEHELIRENVLTLTMSFDKRVHSFMKNIVCAKSNPMRVKHFHYRVEFQLRGAGHIHGVLWTDLEELDKEFPGLKSSMAKLRLSSSNLNEEDKAVLSKFVDKFIKCSLDEDEYDDDFIDIVNSVQKHNHSHTCYKKGPSCRFGFPRLPSERTIIATPLDKKCMSERQFRAEKRKLKDILSKVKTQLESLNEEELVTTSLEDLLKKSGVSKIDYYKALEVSQTGSCIILQRRVSEAYINNYNPEWLKSWNGNMDIQGCLDFFAVTTYITDYYTKSESAMATELKKAFKQSTGLERKDQMKYLVETFLRTRQMGESEALYRMLPQLHLSESDIKCIYVATGFPWNRSAFLIRQHTDKLITGEDEEDEESMSTRKKTFQIPGRDGLFKKAVSIHDKYSARPTSLEHICLAQFAICYEMKRGGKEKEPDYEKAVEGVSSNSHEKKIISWDCSKETPLPINIKLDDELGNMKLRKKSAILRQHKFRQDLDPHEYFYSLLVLYRPWRSEEEELCAHDLEGCKRLLEEIMPTQGSEPKANKKTKIEETRGKLFPLQKAVEEARAMVEDVPDSRTLHIGDDLDPENEKDNEDQADEGLREAEEYAARDPGELTKPSEKSQGASENTLYRKVDISDFDDMCQCARLLDEDQRFAFDIVIKYLKQLRASWKSGLPKPKPPLLKIHGGAGCGKSMLISVMARFVEHLMSLYSDKDPERPAVVKAAATGKAAHNIEGLTYHKAFGIPWGDQCFSLSNKARDAKRNQLSELTVVILDEMSLLKSDALYQIHLRLQEITQSHNAFGGIAVILSGDLMQIPPVMARWIFEEPKNEEFQLSHAIEPLWDQFQPIELRHNHRQGGDRIYGDMLNRIRRGKHTVEDIKQLQSKVTNVFPKGALHLYGTNILVNRHNTEELSKIDGEEEVMKAIYTHPRMKDWRPSIDDQGMVMDTPFKDELHLKIKSRVMVTHNAFSGDGIINGTMGTVAGFMRKQGKVVLVLVTLDKKEDGAITRRKHQGLLKKLKLPDATPIGRECMEISMGKKARRHSVERANESPTVIQFPLVTAWAISIHKSQGENIHSPTPLVADIASVHKKGQGMAYVALGRIQNMDQLYLKSFKPEKIMVSKVAEKEALKIERDAINNVSNQDKWSQDWKTTNCYLLKITSLNIRFAYLSFISY